MKVHVDQQLCQGTGLCTGLAPEILELSRDGTIVLLDDEPGVEQQDGVREAARAWPTQAISITED